MLRQVLGVDEVELSLAILQSLLDNRPPESQRLDYKSELPENREFSRDVAAMANGGGGILIVGIKEQQGIPVAFTPIPLTGEVSRLEQIFGTNIQPFVRVIIQEITAQQGDNHGFIVIQILPSGRTPFAVAEGSGRLGFYIRSGQHRHPLSEAQVEHMYRDRFQRRSEVSARLDELTARAARVLMDNPPPRAYLVAVPVVPAHRLFRPGQSNTRDLISLGHSIRPIFQNPDVGEVIPLQSRPGFKRIEFARGFVDNQWDKYGWIELHDDGAFVGTVVGNFWPPSEMIESGGKQSALFYDTALVAGLLGRLAAYWLLARHLDLVGEVVLRVGIAPVCLPVQLAPSPDRGQMYTSRELREAIATEFNADIADLAVGPPLLRTAKVLLDDIFTAFGWPECGQLSANGELRRRYFGSDWRSSTEGWAMITGVNLTDEVCS